MFAEARLVDRKEVVGLKERNETCVDNTLKQTGDDAGDGDEGPIGHPS